jgi:hypothetical protein
MKVMTYQHGWHGLDKKFINIRRMKLFECILQHNLQAKAKEFVVKVLVLFRK